jgi:chromosome segregation ATPase
MNIGNINLDEIQEQSEVEKLRHTKKELEKYSDDVLNILPVIQKANNGIDKVLRNVAERENREAVDRYEDFRELSTEYEQIKVDLEELPEKIRIQKQKLSDLKEIVEESEQEVDLIESTLMMEISEELDDTGKKKYSNKQMRSAELAKRKKQNEEYQEIKKDLKQSKRAVEQAELEVEKLYNEFKSKRAVMEALKTRMRMLSA